MTNKKILIFDTSVIVELFHNNLLYELATYGESINAKFILPSEVYNELKKSKYFSKIENFIREKFEIINPPENILEEIRLRKPALGPGELSVLATAIFISKYSNGSSVIVVIDDKKGRETAKTLNLKLCGTLKIIIQLKKRNIIDRKRATEIIKNLPNRGFHITEEKVLETLNEIRKDC